MPRQTKATSAPSQKSHKRIRKRVSVYLFSLIIAACDAPNSTASTPPTAPPTLRPSVHSPVEADQLYPFYMPMEGLFTPAVRLFVQCSASQAAGKEVFSTSHTVEQLGGRVEGGYEVTYEALDANGKPCVYPFAPWMPQVAGAVNGTQYIFRSSIPGQKVIFRTSDEWAKLGVRIFEIGPQRVHFEMRDIELDFPKAVQSMGSLHLEAVGATNPGLVTAVIRRSTIFGGKNALFVPGGETMLYVEDSAFSGNIGDNVDQEHTTYINGILVSHLRNSVWYGQKGWQNMASGHQLKDKAYLRLYDRVTVSNYPGVTVPSAMPLIDISGLGFTWSKDLKLQRLAPAQSPREGMVDLRSEILYRAADALPWHPLVSDAWSMPSAPLTVLDQVYLSVFQNTVVESFRSEPYVFALRHQGTHLAPNGTVIEGSDQTAKSQQRVLSLAFNTKGAFDKVYSHEGFTFTDPQLSQSNQWVLDQKAFTLHALRLIGRAPKEANRSN